MLTYLYTFLNIAQIQHSLILKAAKNLKGTEIYINRHDPFRASRAQETDHGTKEKKGGITIKRAVGNSSQQSDQRSKSGARAGSGLQKKPNLKRD